MKVIQTGIEGLVVVEPKVFGDARGFFMETYSERAFRELGLPTNFVQDNFSQSRKGALRGLHFQNPRPQGKLVRVTRGAVWDVAVDLRRDSPTFGRHFGLELSAENRLSFYVPEGFGHGFLTLSEVADFQYKCTDLYFPEHDVGVAWNDPELKVEWPLDRVGGSPILSAKDSALRSLRQLREQNLLF